MQPTADIALLTVRRIEQRLGKPLEIPPLSLTAQKILQLRANPDTHIDELTAVIETDPALAAQVMSWAASPLYAAPCKICSIEDAITRVLGFDLVMNLALGLALGKKFSLPHTFRQDNIDYWKNALYSATLIEGLVRQMPAATRPEAGLAYLAGLLHNFGYLLLAQLFPSYFSLIQQYQTDHPEARTQQADQHLLGITREEICTSLMQIWGMPDELVVAVGQQNSLDYNDEHATYARLVQLAALLLTAADSADPAQLDALCQSLQLKPEQARQALDKVLAAEQALRSLSEQMSH
ncbi:MAG: HDOD domain-containing protein [Gammaproteobacteria bacterium]|nr:HDOD domain-containing protein [Gammaproteobacteria bacterium]